MNHNTNTVDVCMYVCMYVMHVLTRVCVEEPCVQQLGEVGYHPQVDQRADVVGFRLGKFLSVYPLRHVDPPVCMYCRRIETPVNTMCDNLAYFYCRCTHARRTWRCNPDSFWE